MCNQSQILNDKPLFIEQPHHPTQLFVNDNNIIDTLNNPCVYFYLTNNNNNITSTHHQQNHSSNMNNNADGIEFKKTYYYI